MMPKRFQPMSDAVRTRILQSVPDPSDVNDTEDLLVSTDPSEQRGASPSDISLDHVDDRPSLADPGATPGAQADVLAGEAQPTDGNEHDPSDTASTSLPGAPGSSDDDADAEAANHQEPTAANAATTSTNASSAVEVLAARPALPLRRATRSRTSIERQRNVSIKIDEALRRRVDALAHHALESTGFSLNRSRLVADAIVALPDDVEQILAALESVPAVIDMGHTVMLVGTIPEPTYRRLASLALTVRQVSDRSDATNAIAYLAVERHIDRLLR